MLSRKLGSFLVSSFAFKPHSPILRQFISEVTPLRMISSGIKVLDTLDPCVILMKNMMADYEHEWSDRGGIYSLAQGIVYWEPPSTVLDAIEEGIHSKTLHQYCPDEGLPELRLALLQKLDNENNLSNHHVMITSGANQAYMNCVLTLLGNDDKCVFFRPYYFNHIMSTQLAVGNRGVVLGECDENGIPNLEWLDNQLLSDSSIKAVTITNPGNPTGVCLDRHLVQRIVDICRQHQAWLILDCTYEHFQHGNYHDNKIDNDNAASFQCFEDPHVIHIFSFSKGYSLAGYRCGYVVVSKDVNEMYQQMRKVQDTIPICPSRISQYAAMGALRAGRSWVLNNVATLKAGREAILSAVSPLEQIMGGSGAMYIMAKLPKGNNDDQAFARVLVKTYGVAVIPGTFCGFPGWIRVCYSNLPPGKCIEAASRLRQGILEQFGSNSSQCKS
jgi:aromatic aminotransferase